MTIPWENRQGFGLLQSFIKTLTLSLNQPVEFFRTLPKDQGFGKPLTYSMIIICSSVIASALYQLMFQGAFLASMLRYLGQENLHEMIIQSSANGLLIVMTILGSPLQALINVFLYSGIYHLILKLISGTRFPYETSFRAYAYSRGPLLCSLVPALGFMVGAIWSSILFIIGMKEMHGTSYSKSIAAFLIPFVLFCGCLLLGGASLLFMLGILGRMDSASHF